MRQRLAKGICRSRREKDSHGTRYFFPRPQRGHDSFTVIGNHPYGADGLAAPPRWVNTINASKSEFSVHLGDLKSGSQRCDTSYFPTIRNQFDRFTTPLILTSGDNDGTDCHRINNGAYDPLERLNDIRSVFLPKPGVTLGQKPMKVMSQADRGLPENASIRRTPPIRRHQRVHPACACDGRCSQHLRRGGLPLCHRQPAWCCPRAQLGATALRQLRSTSAARIDASTGVSTCAGSGVAASAGDDVDGSRRETHLDVRAHGERASGRNVGENRQLGGERDLDRAARALTPDA